MPSAMDRGYRISRYAAGPVAARIGEPSPSADAWMAEHRAASLILITAWNPMSRPMPRRWNEEAHRRLLRALKGRPVAEGWSGNGPWQEWTIATPGGVRLGRRLCRIFRQRAFVLLRRNRRTLLVYS
ncbi:DUF3293 domain-containing protein [Sabulicella rubraurantiaca]|uniref:DUF3293 domain-containing protein n=1 Tax=Sabulicella rubraurantiaca TaxID=2811429 RepID=UPI001A97B432|nr:DUF3293 domain-containing protein [Sabulicella rubraurantiaca]